MIRKVMCVAVLAICSVSSAAALKSAEAQAIIPIYEETLEGGDKIPEILPRGIAGYAWDAGARGRCEFSGLFATCADGSVWSRSIGEPFKKMSPGFIPLPPDLTIRIIK